MSVKYIFRRSHIIPPSGDDGTDVQLVGCDKVSRGEQSQMRAPTHSLSGTAFFTASTAVLAPAS